MSRDVSSETPKLCLIVPCYNEAGRLNAEAFRNFVNSSRAVHFVFVNDGSHDSTSSVLEELRLGLEDRIDVVSYQENKGKAEAVRTGALFALTSSVYPVLGYWDADLATPLDTSLRLMSILELHSQIDFVFGSRVKLCGRYIQRKALRHYLGRVFATAVSIMLKLSIYDTQCGAKLFRANKSLRNIFEKPFLSRWIFDVEILARLLRDTDAAQLEGRIYEYPLEVWEDISGSKLRARDFFRAIFDLVKIKHKYL